MKTFTGSHVSFTVEIHVLGTDAADGLHLVRTLELPFAPWPNMELILGHRLDAPDFAFELELNSVSYDAVRGLFLCITSERERAEIEALRGIGFQDSKE